MGDDYYTLLNAIEDYYAGRCSTMPRIPSRWSHIAADLRQQGRQQAEAGAHLAMQHTVHAAAYRRQWTAEMRDQLRAVNDAMTPREQATIREAIEIMRRVGG